MNEVKPCPFCGKPLVWIGFHRYWECSNLDCDVVVRSTRYISEEEQIKALNTRPLEDALQARIAALEAVLREWVLCWEAEIITASENGVGAFGVDEGRVNGEALVNDLADRTNALLPAEVKE